jgi:predicted dehydrogenase
MPYTPQTREWAPELGGGCLLDMGIYPVAFSWLFLRESFNKSPKKIVASEKLAPNGVERHLSAILEFGDSFAKTAFVEMTASFSSKLHNWGFIYGTEGYIAIPNFWSAREAFLYRQDQIVESFNDERRGSGFEFQITSASNAILNGQKQSEVVTLEDSMAFQRIMTAIKNSI